MINTGMRMFQLHVLLHKKGSCFKYPPVVLVVYLYVSEPNSL